MSDKKKAIELFQKYNVQDNNDVCLEDERKHRILDSEIKKYFKEAGVMDPRELRQLEKSKRDDIHRNSN